MCNLTPASDQLHRIKSSVKAVTVGGLRLIISIFLVHKISYSGNYNRRTMFEAKRVNFLVPHNS